MAVYNKTTYACKLKISKVSVLFVPVGNTVRNTDVARGS